MTGPSGASREQFHFQVITTPTSDTLGTTLLLHFDNRRYIFGNVAEGTQRACIQRSCGLKKVRHVFLTGQVKWRNTGGLIGLILTLADVQRMEREAEKVNLAVSASTKILEEPRVSVQPKLSPAENSLTVHGGENLLHTLACARRFVFRKGMPVSINEFVALEQADVEEPTWKDENVKVWAMPIAPCVPEKSYANDMENPNALDADPSRPSANGRKRSHDQFNRGMDESSGRISLDQHLRDQRLRQDIVSGMFQSEWNRDALFETSLGDVGFPALVFIRDPDTNKIVKYQGPRIADGQPRPDIKVLTRKPWPSALTEDLPPARDIGFKPAMSYIVQGYPQRGRFDPHKARALGVPRGPLYSALAAGQAVTLKDGTVVEPGDVLGPTKLSRGIAIVELPSEEYVTNLIGRPEWQSEHLRDGICAICWILGPGVASNPHLKTFMESMPGVEHIISSEDVCPNYLALESSAASAIQLSLISAKNFPIPFHNNDTVPQSKGFDETRQLPALPAFTVAERGLKIQVQPDFLLRKDEIPPLLNTAEVVRSLPEKVREYAALAHTQVAIETASSHDIGAENLGCSSEHDPEIITLGTGSALPSKYRNVSATLLRMGRYGNFLFDCGENTLAQLKRVFDPPSLHEVLVNLKFIWLSHLHADHHLGTVSVLNARREAFIEEAKNRGFDNTDESSQPSESVFIASTTRMLHFFQEYESVETLGNVRFFYCDAEPSPYFGRDETSLLPLRSHLAIKHFRTTMVEHCSGSQAISMTFANDFQFSYSGDCRPSAGFAAIGKGSDVLVHEATFDDDMEGDALAKKHSTTGEALGVAAKMEAKNVILTHFSQRYQKLPVMENMKMPSAKGTSLEQSPKDTSFPADANNQSSFLDKDEESEVPTEGLPTPSDSKRITETEPVPRTAGLKASPSPILKPDMNICIAFDYMRVRVSEIKHMKKFNPALAALFEVEQKDSIDEGATAQEKSNNINRAKAPKKSQPIVDTDHVTIESPPKTDADQEAAQQLKVAQRRLKRDKKRNAQRLQNALVNGP